MPDLSSIAPAIAQLGGALSLLAVILTFVLARSRGSREQAGRQDREARVIVVRSLREFAKRLDQEEIRRKAIHSGGTVIATEDLRHVDSLGLIWNALDALTNPALDPRVGTRVERALRGLTGDTYIDYLKRRVDAPQRPKSMNEMHNWMRELVQNDVVDVTKPRASTTIDMMFDAPRDPDPVARVRREIEGLINDLRH